MWEWALDLENKSNRVVKLDILPNGMRVSTIWLGLDHSWGGGPPLIFETMVFDDKASEEGRGEDFDSQRYSTREEALEGHRELVEKYLAMAKFEEVDLEEDHADERRKTDH